MRISLIDMDLSGNCLGRTLLLADLLLRLDHETEVIGSIKSGRPIWPPGLESAVPIKSVRFRRYPSYVAMAEEMLDLVQGEVLYAVKPVMSSFGVGLLGRKRLRKPLILDIDDWELGFYIRADFWGKVGRMLHVKNPNSMLYTWRLEKRVSEADAITVSNGFLQNRFGGVIIPHVRDTEQFDPTKVDGVNVRARFNWRDEFVVMFLGTPRAHKGITDLVQAMDLIDSDRVHLALIGMDPDGNEARGITALLGKKVTISGMISFSEVPSYLAAADVIAVPQRDTFDTKGQLPAKIFDAMALGKPLIVTALPNITEVVGEASYLVRERDPEDLARGITFLKDNPEEARRLGFEGRKRCLSLYNYNLASQQLERVLKHAVSNYTPE